MKIAPTIIPCYTFPQVSIFFEEILDLALMANILGNTDVNQLYKTYQRNMTKPMNSAFVDNLIIGGRILGCIPPRYSDATFPTMLKNQEMTFALCCAYYFNNVSFLNKAPNEYLLHQFFANGVVYQHLYLISPHLLPLRFVQNRRNNASSHGCQIYGKLLPVLQNTQNYHQFLRQPWFWLSNGMPATAPPVGLTAAQASFVSNLQAPPKAVSMVKGANSNAF